jgi:hypothetical protein
MTAVVEARKHLPGEGEDLGTGAVRPVTLVDRVAALDEGLENPVARRLRHAASCRNRGQ